MATAHRLYPLPFMDGHPLDESEWNNVLQLLEQVNRPKARVLSAIYREHVTNAWRNYLRVYEDAYARIEELNRRIDEQRERYEHDLKTYMQMLHERETFWEDQIREPRDEYMRLSVAVGGISGSWTSELTQSVHGPREYLSIIQTLGQRDDADQSEEKKANSSEQYAGGAAASAEGDGRNPQVLTMDVTGRQQPPEDETQREPSGGSRHQEQASGDEKLPALTKEEVADENQLPTFAEPPIPRWLNLAFTAVLGLLGGHLLCVATGFTEPTGMVVLLAALGASAVLYGIWATTRSAAAIASDAFHLHWFHSQDKKLRVIVWVFLVTAFVVLVIQAGWHAFLSLNARPGGVFDQGRTATAGYLMWLLWPWYLLIAGLDGFLRGRGEALGNRIHAEITRAKRAEASLQAARIADRHINPQWPTSETSTLRDDDQLMENAEQPLADNPPEGVTMDAGPVSPHELLMQYRRARATYESLRRQRDLDLAFIGRRIKDMQSFLSPTHYVPSRHEQQRIEMARADYEKVCTWFLTQLADALRDVGGGVNAGEIIRRFAEQFGKAIPAEADGNKHVEPVGGLA
jgi:hypothetical protein